MAPLAGPPQPPRARGQSHVHPHVPHQDQLPQHQADHSRVNEEGAAGACEWLTATSLRGNGLNLPVVCVWKTDVISLREAVRRPRRSKHVSHQPQNNPGFTQVRGDYGWGSSGETPAGLVVPVFMRGGLEVLPGPAGICSTLASALGEEPGGGGGERSPFNQTDALQTWS